AGVPGAGPAFAAGHAGQDHAGRQAVADHVLAAGRGLSGVAHHYAVAGLGAGVQHRRGDRLADPHVRRIADLAENVLQRFTARGQHDAADGRWRGGLWSRIATEAAGRGQAIERLWRLGRLGHRVDARAQAVETVAALAVGHGTDAHLRTGVVGAGQHDFHPGDAGLARIDLAVVVAVVVHAAGDDAATDLAEVVGGGMLVGAQQDAADPRYRVGDRRGRAADAAGDGLAVAGARRLLRFGHRVVARQQPAEAVGAQCIGDDLAGDGIAGSVDAVQADGHTGDALLA